MVTGRVFGRVLDLAERLPVRRILADAAPVQTGHTQRISERECHGLPTRQEPAEAERLASPSAAARGPNAPRLTHPTGYQALQAR